MRGREGLGFGVGVGVGGEKGLLGGGEEVGFLHLVVWVWFGCWSWLGMSSRSVVLGRREGRRKGCGVGRG